MPRQSSRWSMAWKKPLIYQFSNLWHRTNLASQQQNPPWKSVQVSFSSGRALKIGWWEARTWGTGLSTNGLYLHQFVAISCGTFFSEGWNGVFMGFLFSDRKEFGSMDGNWFEELWCSADVKHRFDRSPTPELTAKSCRSAKQPPFQCSRPIGQPKNPCWKRWISD